jgi:hypothetical protein
VAEEAVAGEEEEEQAQGSRTREADVEVVLVLARLVWKIGQRCFRRV